MDLSEKNRNSLISVDYVYFQSYRNYLLESTRVTTCILYLVEVAGLASGLCIV
jgi:hypothetical protein